MDREEGVHGPVDVEWWYHFGWLTDEDGGDWAWVSSFFRYNPKIGPAYRYELSDLVDLKTGRAAYRSRVGSEAFPVIQALTGQAALPAPHQWIPGLPAERPGDPLKLAYGEDRFEKTGPRRYRLRVEDLDLDLRSVSEPMPVEGTGLTGIRKPEDMHYYTIPRLEASGTARGRAVKGLFWYDHQWGAAWSGPGINWSWWGLQLEDGSDVNAYVLRDPESGKVHRSVITRDGRPRPLEARATDWWTSAAGVRYPVAWRLSGGGLDLKIKPFFRERECPVFGQKPIWEGPVRVTGTREGRGFQELVGWK